VITFGNNGRTYFAPKISSSKIEVMIANAATLAPPALFADLGCPDAD
jgi:hypothetical protein